VRYRLVVSYDLNGRGVDGLLFTLSKVRFLMQACSDHFFLCCSKLVTVTYCNPVGRSGTKTLSTYRPARALSIIRAVATKTDMSLKIVLANYQANYPIVQN
jgi:hypothetical protein